MIVPKIVIKHQVYSKIRAYCDLCSEEVSALGTVKVFDNIIYINDVFLFNQTVSATLTEICQEDLSKFVYQCIKNEIDPSSLRLWWHSHVNMEVFWSPTDLNTINKFSKEWMISIVSNKKDNFKVRLDISSPIRICLDDLPYTIEYDKTNNAQIRAEIDAKVHSQFFDKHTISDFFGGESQLYQKPSFTSPHGDPKTVVMNIPTPKPKSTIQKCQNKSIITKIKEFIFGEHLRFQSVEINKTVAPKPTTPVIAPLPQVEKTKPLVEEKK